MDPVRNPFAPGAGTPPPELAGRSEIVAEAYTALQRVPLGRPTQSIVLVGLRGVGKTVLLNKIVELSEQEHYLSIQAEAHEGKPLPELIVPGLRQTLLKLSAIENAKEKARLGLRVLKSFLNSVHISYQGLELGLSVAPELGVADSGDIEADLPALVCAIGDAAKAASRRGSLTPCLSYTARALITSSEPNIHTRFLASWRSVRTAKVSIPACLM